MAAGLRVAICDQAEDPKQAKGLVRREVTRIVTPARSPMRALGSAAEQLSGGHRRPASRGPGLGRALHRPILRRCFRPQKLADQLARIDPAECLLAEGAPNAVGDAGGRKLSRGGLRGRSVAAAAQAACRNNSAPRLSRASALTDAADGPAFGAAGAVLDYLIETQKSTLAHLDRLIPYRVGQTLEMDEADPPQPRNYPHDPRRPPRRFAAGSARPHDHRDGLAAAGRLAGESPDRSSGDSRSGSEAVAELVADARLCDDLRRRLQGIHDLRTTDWPA